MDGRDPEPFMCELLGMWFGEYAAALERSLGVAVEVARADPGKDYGCLPGPPAMYVLRAELRDGVTLSVFRGLSLRGLTVAGGDSDDWEVTALWQLVVHRWTVDGTAPTDSTHGIEDDPGCVAAAAADAVQRYRATRITAR